MLFLSLPDNGLSKIDFIFVNINYVSELPADVFGFGFTSGMSNIANNSSKIIITVSTVGL